MRVNWSLRAQDDFNIIYRQALDEDARYALNLLSSLEKAISRLSEYPQIGMPVGSAGHRKWRLARTPFLIIYRADPQGLHILRVQHERQDWSIAP
jgi:plasmid stabilization system protein ParE